MYVDNSTLSDSQMKRRNQNVQNGWNREAIRTF